MENLSYFQFELWAQILKWLFLFEVTSYMPSWVKKVNTQNTSPYSTESLTHRGMNDWRYTVPQNSIHWISSHRELNLKGVKSNGESWRKLWKTVLCFQFHLVLHSWTLKWFIHVLKKKKKSSDSHFLMPSWILGTAFPNSNHQRQIRPLNFTKIK